MASPIQNALSVDVEDYFHVAALSRVVRPDDWEHLESRVEWNTQRLLELFSNCDAQATFFILGWVAERFPRLVREIKAAGHEIACHGLSHKLIYEQSREEFAEETRIAKAILEDIIGEPVLGYRAASWSITRESYWALDTLLEIGFAYDSSIFPVRHDRYGIPGASVWPGEIDAPNGARLVEFPPSTIGFLGTRLPVAGGGYFRLLPLGITQWGLRRINSVHRQPFMFYLHPWEIDPDQPRFRAAAVSRFRHYTNLRKTASRLRTILREFRCRPARDVLSGLGILDI